MSTPKLRLEWLTAADLNANPKNWRRHPPEQMRALRDAIDEVGWAGVLLYNERTRHLIDGHARRDTARPGERLPVLVGSWNDKDEAKILVTLDPLACMAEHDLDALAQLVEEVDTESVALRQVIESTAAQVLTFDDLPESVRQNAEELAEIKEQRRAGNENIKAKTDTERYVVIVFKDRTERERALARLGLPSDERYLSADSVEIRKRSLVRATGYKTAPTDKSGATG